MRQGGAETAPRCLKCNGFKCTLSGERQPTDQSPLVGERPGLEEMVRDVSGALVGNAGIELLDRIGDTGMQSLLARGRDARKQGLTYEFMGKGKRPLWPLGARDDDSYVLRLLDDGKQFVNVDLADPIQQLKTETAPDHRGGGKHPLLVLVEPLQSAADDQPDVFRNVDLIDRNVSAEFPGCVKNLPFLDQMPVQLLDEERIALAAIKYGAHQIFRRLPVAEPIQHLRDGFL